MQVDSLQAELLGKPLTSDQNYANNSALFSYVLTPK